MDGLLAFCACVLGFFLLVGLIIGGWQAGWWFKEADVNRQSHVNRSSYGFQQAHEDELAHQITDITNIASQIADPTTSPDQRVALGAQRKAEINEACRSFDQITDPTPSHAAWGAQNCGTNR